MPSLPRLPCSPRPSSLCPTPHPDCAHLEAEGRHIWNDRPCYKWDEANEFYNYINYYYVVEYEAPAANVNLNGKGWLPYLNGHYYEIVDDSNTVGGSLTYARSKSYALAQSYQDLRGYMGMITSSHENDFVWGLLKSFHLADGSYTDLRIGGTDIGSEGHWRWDGLGLGSGVVRSAVVTALATALAPDGAGDGAGARRRRPTLVSSVPCRAALGPLRCSASPSNSPAQIPTPRNGAPHSSTQPASPSASSPGVLPRRRPPRQQPCRRIRGLQNIA